MPMVLPKCGSKLCVEQRAEQCLDRRSRAQQQQWMTALSGFTTICLTSAPAESCYNTAALSHTARQASLARHTEPSAGS